MALRQYTLERLSSHHPIIHIQQGWGNSKSGVALRNLVVAPKVGEKGVALRVVEKSASYITPLHAPGVNSISVGGKIRFQTL